MKSYSIDHMVLIIKNLEETEVFYSKFLGKPSYKDKETITYNIGGTKLFFVLPSRKLHNKEFNKDEIGLNHLAFGVLTLPRLKAIEKLLSKSKINNSGIQIDKYGRKPFIWFDDPNKIRLEFYLRK